jgi:hypothetical protein
MVKTGFKVEKSLVGQRIHLLPGQDETIRLGKAQVNALPQGRVGNG